MDYELTSARRPAAADDQHYNQIDAVRNKDRRQTTQPEGIHDSMENIDEIVIEGFWGLIQPPKVRLAILAVFTCLIMVAGILIIYFTTRPSHVPCQPVFQRTWESSIVPNAQSRSIAVGDLNNDDQIDFAVANSGLGTIGIFLSNGNGTFANQQPYSAGSDSSPYSIVIYDFNNDTYQDIAVANYGINSVGIFFGKGTGAFSNQSLFSLGSSRPLFLTIGDFNKDGRMDIAVVNNGTSNIGILLGYGDGSFQNQITYSTDYDSFPNSLAVGDFNNDNLPDIAVANYGTDNIGIFLNSGNGIFENQQIYPTSLNSNPSSVALGDFNNDKHLDIVVANYGTGNIGILFGYGNGSFQPQITYTIHNNIHPQYITVGDLNKDNQSDVVIVDSEGDNIYFLPGYGNGSFAAVTIYIGVVESDPYYVVLTDVNNNNQSDIITANYGTNNILALIDYSSVPDVQQTNYDVVTASYSALVAVSDFNNDGILDILSHTNQALIILLGLGEGMFENSPTFSIPIIFNLQYLSVGDLNNDNKTDIIIADLNFNVIGVFLGYGNGSFATVTTYPTGNNSAPYWIALGDVNNDNRIDIITANSGTSNFGIFFGNGDGTFNTMKSYSTGTGSLPISVAVGDINNDHYLDIIVALQNVYVLVFLGQGNGSFSMQGTLSVPANANNFAVALGDFNSDNYLDIVTTNPYGNSISVFLGYGNGTFTPDTTYITGNGPISQYVIVGDFNNDDISDIAVSNFGIDNIVIFYGYGNGTFILARTYPTGSGSKPFGLTAADLDKDNHLEFVVVLFGTGAVAVLTEYYAAEFGNQTTYPTSTALHPYSIAVGDFNNDNKSDVVVANSGTGNLGILFGTGNGTFSTEMMYEIGDDSYPEYVLTYDINKDNQLDIISVNSKDNSISVILGYGNGTFAKQLIYPTGQNTYPVSVAVGNFNNDTYLDLAIANEGTNNIGILFGFNYTTLKNQSDIRNPSFIIAPYAIVTSDFNHDGYLDLAIASSGFGVFVIMFGLGNGNFNLSALVAYGLGSGYQLSGIALGNFNNDNYTDIVVIERVHSLVLIFLGTTGGRFNFASYYSTGANGYPLGVAVGDFNNDGRLDIVVANANISTVVILLGYGNGIFYIQTSYSTGVNSYPNSVAVGDFNSDGKLDIVVTNYNANNIGLFIGLGNGTFTNQIILSTGAASMPNWIIANDFNKDGYLDIAVANWNLNNVGILLGYGNGNFVDIQYYSSGQGSLPFSITAGDFNNDGKLDIAVTNVGTSNIVVLFGFGDGTFLLGSACSTAIGADPFGLTAGDFNKDGLLDAAVANVHTNGIQIFLGYDTQLFAGVTLTNSTSGSAPHSVATGDLNSDGLSDIVIANYGTDSIGIIFGRTDRNLQTIIQNLTEVGAAPYFVAVSDLNNDHHLDIVVSNSGTNDVAIFLGYGNGTFASEMSHYTGSLSRPYTLSIGDLNNDNILDLAIANSGTSNLYLLYGYGNGTFGNDTSYPFGYNYLPYSVAISDFTQNNFQDIAVACYSTDHIETIIKQC